MPLLPLWAVRPVQSLSACARVHSISLLCVKSYKPNWVIASSFLNLVCSHVYFVNIICFCVIPIYLNFAVNWKDLLPVLALQFYFTHIYVYCLWLKFARSQISQPKTCFKILVVCKTDVICMAIFQWQTETTLETSISLCAPSRLLRGAYCHIGIQNCCQNLLVLVWCHWQNPCLLGRLMYFEMPPTPPYAVYHRITNEGRVNKKW